MATSSTDNIVFLDMDGVLANFRAAAAAVYNVPETSFPVDTYGVYDACGVSKTKFWNRIRFIDNFWLNMPVLDNGRILFREMKRLKYRVIILTSPDGDSKCYSEKFTWLRTNIDPDINSKDFCPFPEKHLLAAQNRVLIDDFEDNVNKFVAAGGMGIIWPALGNSFYASRHHAVEMTLRLLKSVNF